MVTIQKKVPGPLPAERGDWSDAAALKGAWEAHSQLVSVATSLLHCCASQALSEGKRWSRNGEMQKKWKKEDRDGAWGEEWMEASLLESPQRE